MTKTEKKEIKALVRQLLITRDTEKCRRCGTTEKLQASHIYSVGSWKKLEYDTDNIILLCYRCHFHWWHKEPLAAAEWIKTSYPLKVLERLKLRQQQTGKGTHDYKTLKLVIGQEIKNLQKSKEIQYV